MCDAHAPIAKPRATRPLSTATSRYGPMGESVHSATKTPPSVQPNSESSVRPARGVTGRASVTRTKAGWYRTRAAGKRYGGAGQPI
eukprot:1468770-Prymnesium_polylepis.1